MRLRMTAALIAALSMPLGVQAADMGTYRPGDPYLQVPAQKPDECASQCQGDALCRGWNFVYVDRNRAICEFNVRSVSPVPNNYSVSGDNGSAYQSSNISSSSYGAPRRSSRSVFQTQLPGTTVRVGEIPRPKPQVRRVVQRPAPVQSAQLQASTQRGIAHTSMQQRNVPPPPARRQATPQTRQQIAERPQAMSFRHALDHAPGEAPAIPQTPQPRFTPQLDTQNDYIPATQAPALPPQPPRLSDLVPPPVSQAPQHAPPVKADPGLAGAPAASAGSTSLFGSLYDDVKTPRSLTPQDIADPDAPIPTVTSVPIAEIKQSPL